MATRVFKFANILLNGPCNYRCPYCIGKQTGSGQVRRSNLHQFPLTGLDRFVRELNRFGVKEVSLTGENTDPQLYRHERRLLAYLRHHVPGVRVSLHTNGAMALKKMAIFNLYDRVTLSMPSFRRETYQKMTGANQIIPLQQIVAHARIHIKISTIVTETNVAEVPEIIQTCRDLGITRMVLRKRYGDSQDYGLFSDRVPQRYYANNPVYVIDGMEVTVWDFCQTNLDCLNLFSDGTVTDTYDIHIRRPANANHPIS